MSINQIISGQKTGFNVSVNTMKIDGEITAPNIVGVPGDYLIIANGKVEYGPAPGNLNNGIVALIPDSFTLPAGNSLLPLATTGNPYNNSLYAFFSSTSSITILLSGVYQISLNFSTPVNGVQCRAYVRFNTGSGPFTVVGYDSFSNINVLNPQYCNTSVVGVSSVAAGTVVTFTADLQYAGKTGFGCQASIIKLN